MTHRVATNAIWNILGQVVAMGAALVAIPVLLDCLGPARLGLFTLAIGVIGFSGLFDLGLSRALTQTVSSAMGEGRPRASIAATAWKIVGWLAIVGVAWGAVLWFSADFLIRHALSLVDPLAAEARLGLRALALSVPFALVSSGTMGALEGLQEFRLLNIWRMPMSVFQFGFTVVVALLDPNVGWVIAALAATRVMACLLWTFQLHGRLPLQRSVKAAAADLHHALRFGGWLSVSNLIGPLMAYADRFYLATIFAPSFVAHYTIPFDATVRATVLPQTAMNALFPAMAMERGRPVVVGEMLGVSIRAVLAIMLPPLLIVALFAKPLLGWWLNPTFAVPATPVLQLLLVGVLLNAAAHPPYALLQAHGRSDLTAKLHLLELPVFLIMLVAGVHLYGVPGAAGAWLFRAGLDMLMLYLTAIMLQPSHKRLFAGALFWILLATAALLVAQYGRAWYLRLGIGVVGCVICTTVFLRLWVRFRLQSGNQERAHETG